MIGLVAATLVIGMLAAACTHLHLRYVWSACAAIGGEGGQGDTVTLLVMTLVLVAHVLQ
ncbi:MAG TPA: hypothetical protein VE076_09395 [Nitrososphaeraceae archaeon]|nr:hypothetical protein [Nitrososphaeraceae archaeon]